MKKSKWNPDEYEEHVYEFQARGVTKEGNRATLTGEITGPKGYPSPVFDAARASILKLSPEFRFTKGPTLKILRGKTRALAEKKRNENNTRPTESSAPVQATGS